jgi:hypothetical protein
LGGFFISKKNICFTTLYAVELKVTITYIALESDWNIEDVLDGRSISRPDAQQDLIEMFREDLPYIFANSKIEFTYEHTK